LTNTLGLTDLLAGRTKKEKAIVQSEVPGLSILTQGSLPSNPAEILDSEAFKNFIAEVNREYEFVILDCPPVLAVADPCIVGGLVNAVLVVLQLNERSRPQVQKMMELLRVVNANVIGTVLNSSILDEDRMASAEEKYGIGYGYGTYSNKTKSYLSAGAPSNGSANPSDN
jgi:capsular exopolysaccharide synthesis family protein